MRCCDRKLKRIPWRKEEKGNGRGGGDRYEMGGRLQIGLVGRQRVQIGVEWSGAWRICDTLSAPDPDPDPAA